MGSSQDLINFDVIEEHKENIQSLPQGRSARQLARILSPQSTSAGKDVTVEGTKTLNDAIRQEYENELKAIADSDDPLDIYNRYIKWTFDAYPSAQSTPQSQLLPLLERATKAFLNSPEYKNDPRYIKWWMHYIHLFSDAPRETFAFLARHNIGERLALFYEEFAAWLETAERWTQADEVYQLGIEREARPTERLMRKYTQFQQRYQARPPTDNEPSSPALPKVRTALAAKVDPFAPASTEEAQQQQRSTSANTTKLKKPKMAIFSDAEPQAPPQTAAPSNGWDSIGSMKERKKENMIEAQPWAGQTLKAGKRTGTATKMEVFKDPNDPRHSRSTKQPEVVVNPRTGRAERVFVSMDAVYADDGQEFSFEELRALRRGWSTIDWKASTSSVLKENPNPKVEPVNYKAKELEDVENLTTTFDQKLDITDSTLSQQDATKENKPSKQKKIKVREVKQETQTVKLRTDSPTRSKPRKKVVAEPTMTLHSKAAHNDIYDMYNNASRSEGKDDSQSGVETDFDDDTFSTAGESFGTGRMSTTNSEFGDDTISSIRSFGADDTSISPWSDFTTGKISKVLKKARSAKHKQVDEDDQTESIAASQDQTHDAFDTQAIAAIANQDFGELDTIAIARIAGSMTQDVDADEVGEVTEDLHTPVEPPACDQIEVIEKSRFVPIPPVDYEPTPMRPFRDTAFLAQNKLPFMTPIVERTESSLAASTIYHNQFAVVQTPSRSNEHKDSKFESPSKLKVDDLLLESPISNSTKRKNQEENDEAHSPKKIVTHSPINENQKIPFPLAISTQSPQLAEPKVTAGDVFKTPVAVLKPVEPVKRSIHKGPIIADLQCNPCDDSVIQQILMTVHPAPSSYPGFHDHASDSFNHFSQIRSYTRKLAKQTTKSSPRKALSESTKAMAPLLRFQGTTRVYAVKRELGEGAFAPVYLVESAENDATSEEDDECDTTSGRAMIEALKAENEPKTLTWEFHILHLLKSRLGRSSRTMQSIILAHECHLYRDECYLVLEYHAQGTLLDLVNACRTENIRAGKTAEGLEEPVAMWLAVELLRNMEEIHKVGLLHGDLKADNCLVRLNTELELDAPYNRHGDRGWNEKGLTLIDFGRGIDTRVFKPEARFIADWKAEETDCPEIREAKPWKWEIDLFGAAGVIHSLLFGKYIETMPNSGGGLGQKKEWKLRDNLKRYWEKDIWSEVFTVLINGCAGKKDDEIRRELQRIRGLMEEWLEKESERNGRDLRAGIRRCERLVGAGAGNAGGSKARR